MKRDVVKLNVRYVNITKEITSSERPVWFKIVPATKKRSG